MKNNKNGFTLIELLAVILVTGILVGIAYPQYFKFLEKSYSAEALALFGPISYAQQRYYLVNNAYAETFDGLDIEINNKDNVKVIGATLETPHFIITLHGVEGNKAGVIATKKDGKYIYTVARSYNTRNIACDNEVICPSLLSNYQSDISEVVDNTPKSSNGNGCPGGVITCLPGGLCLCQSLDY